MCVTQHHLEAVICDCSSSLKIPGCVPNRALVHYRECARAVTAPCARARTPAHSSRHYCAVLASVLSPHCSGRIKHGRRPGDGVLNPPTNRVPSSLIGSALIHQPKQCARGILGRVVLIETEDKLVLQARTTTPRTLHVWTLTPLYCKYARLFVSFSLLRDRP